MLIDFILTVWYFNLALFAKFLNFKKRLKRIYYCGVSLNNKTLRYKEKSIKDFLIALKIYKFIFYSFLKKTNTTNKFNKQSKSAIYDATTFSKDLRIEYIEKLSGEKIECFFSKDNLLIQINIWQTTILLLFLLLSFIPIFLIYIFSKNKLKYPLLIIEIVECFNLLQLLKINKITKLHYFCIYERDSNICAFILMKCRIYINKIPSEVPLHFWNKIIIANELSTCFGYQKQEVECYKKTMFINKVTSWVPEQFFESPKRFLLAEMLRNICEFKIGFFSSGNWLREKINDVDLGYNDKENEELLFKTLINYAVIKKIKLQIFLHPLEKNAKYTEIVNSYYNIYINNTEIFLADKSVKSIEGFDKIDLGIALYSTLMFERLALGFKTLIAPWDYTEFPIPNSSFSNICSKSSDDIIELIENNINLTADEFFTKNQITELVYQNLSFNN